VNITHSNFTIIFDSGVGIQVAAHDGLLHAVVSLPPSYKVRMVNQSMIAWFELSGDH
jgi:hypothetical protein